MSEVAQNVLIESQPSSSNFHKYEKVTIVFIDKTNFKGEHADTKSGHSSQLTTSPKLTFPDEHVI